MLFSRHSQSWRTTYQFAGSIFLRPGLNQFRQHTQLLARLRKTIALIHREGGNANTNFAASMALGHPVLNSAVNCRRFNFSIFDSFQGTYKFTSIKSSIESLQDQYSGVVPRVVFHSTRATISEAKRVAYPPLS